MTNFNKIYEEIYKESYNFLEKKRKNIIIKTVIASVMTLIGIAIYIGGGLIVGSDSYGWLTVLAFILIVIIMMALLLVIPDECDYKDFFKQKVIGALVKKMDKNLKYDADKGISSVLYRQGEFEVYDTYSSEDLIEGILDEKYVVRMAEVHTQYESTDSEGNIYTKTIFHGIYGNVECAKNIGTELKIHSNKVRIEDFLNEKTGIKMDSSEFEKYFDVYAGNKIIAMQILTADIMDMMTQFIEESKIKYELTIKGNQIYIRFHTGKVFEPNMLYTSSLDYSLLKRYYDIISFIFKISGELKKAIEDVEI